MNRELFLAVIETAKEFMKNNTLDNIDKNKEYILFPLIESLDYDILNPLEFVKFPVYGISTNDCFDYGSAIDFQKEKFKTVFKVVEYGSDLRIFDKLIQECLVVNSNIKYFIITDSVNYLIYENTSDTLGTNISYQEIGEFNIIDDFSDIENNEKYFLLNLLSKNPEKVNKSENTIIEKPKMKEVKEKNTNEKLLDFSKYLKMAVIGIITVMFLIVAFNIINPSAKTDEGGVISSDNPSKNKGLFGLKNNTDTSIQYINLKTIMELNITGEDNLEINFITDLREGAVIKYELFCNDKYKVLYDVIKKNGQSNIRYQIPSDWSYPEVKIAAYMRFDEKDYPQPDNVRKLYGDNGEYIVQKPETPQYGLIYKTINHSNPAVIDYVNTEKRKKIEELEKSRKIDFEKLELQTDLYGNQKVLPKGFDMESANIEENRNIYPSIYYDKKNNKAIFQIVSGFNDTNWVKFDSVGFYSDGHEWNYLVNSNVKKVQVNGYILSEWAYFNDVDTPNLLKDLTLLSNSKESRVSFSGLRLKTHELTMEEKENIRYMMYIYKKYYVEGLDLNDIQLEKEYVDLNYLKLPDKMLLQQPETIKQISNLKKQIETDRLNNKDTKSNIELMAKLSKEYKLVEKPISDKIFSDIKLKGYKTSLSGREDIDYIRIDFNYKNKGLIEDGYIPYILIFNDNKIFIPIKEINGMIPDNDYLVEIVKEDLYYQQLVVLIKSMKDVIN